ncbi:protein shisa-4-like [Micropterus salmoides]|uniref:protein shisa-4-like n=1 Tax=Micropterus salmoides TaxID=27706 RepID=UPI0018EC6A4C|nr:protein shisa-4-like [Micropterus salmoides]
MLLGYLLQGGTDRLKLLSHCRVKINFLLHYIKAVMGPRILVCVILLPAVWAGYCSSYWDTDGFFYETQQCRTEFCCGRCNNKYCCSEKKYHLTLEQQEACLASNPKKSNLAVLLGSILGCVIPIVLCVALVICFVAPCCLLYKKFRKGPDQRNRTVRNSTTVVNSAQQPLSPFGYQPGYEVPTAPPPSYLEATALDHTQAAFTPGHHFLSQPYALPQHPGGPAQLPYNPSYGPNP